MAGQSNLGPHWLSMVSTCTSTRINPTADPLAVIVGQISKLIITSESDQLQAIRRQSAEQQTHVQPEYLIILVTGEAITARRPCFDIR